MSNFENEDPARRGFREEFEEAIEGITNSDNRIAQIAVIYGLDMAQSMFLLTFKSVENFQNTPQPEQMNYLNKLHATEEGTRQKDSMVGLGMGLFKMWLTTVMQNDEELISSFMKKIEKLKNLVA